jgi:hypothetical protein
LGLLRFSTFGASIRISTVIPQNNYKIDITLKVYLEAGLPLWWKFISEELFLAYSIAIPRKLKLLGYLTVTDKTLLCTIDLSYEITLLRVMINNSLNFIVYI